MYDLPDMDSLRAVLDQPLERNLHTLLADRLSDTLHCGLQDHTHVIVVEAHDEEEAVEEAIGFNPLRSRIDGSPEVPDWDWIERHEGGWYELLYCVGNTGFAYILMVEDEAQSPLAALCRKYCPCE